MSAHCPRCGKRYAYGMNEPHRRSRDHILPLSRDGRRGVMIHVDVRNIEEMCQSCNGLRAACGHCWGAVACVKAVTENPDQAAATMRRWIAASKDRTGAEAERKRKAKEAVRIGMLIYKIGEEEFIWPADTAAKRVWNLATLARGSAPASWFREKERRLAPPDAEIKTNY